MALERNPHLGTPEFTTAAAGSKLYGVGRTGAATAGALSSDGYNERERKRQARKRAIQNRLSVASQPGSMGSTQPQAGGY